MEVKSEVSIANVILCGIATCVLVDGLVLHLYSAAPISTKFHVLWASLIWASVVSAGSVVAFVVLWHLGHRIGLAMGRPRFMSALIPGIPLGYIVWFMTNELLAGQGFAQMTQAAQIKIVATFTAAIGPTLAIWLTALSNRKLQRTKKPFLLVLQALGVVLLVAALTLVDATVYPRLYRSFHFLIWLTIFAAVFLWRVRFEIRRGVGEHKRARSFKFAAIFLAVGSSFLADSLVEATTRRTAWGDTLFLKRALMHIVPARDREPIEVNPSILASLSKVETICPEDLDRLLPNRRKMNIVLISIDALRADRVGRRGYKRDLTPNLDALSAKSADFSETWTCCPATLPSFSSTLRSNHWMHNDVNMDRQKIVIKAEDRQALLPTEMKKLGYRTEAVLGVRHSFVIDRLETGFDRFNSQGWGSSQNAERVTDYGLAALDHGKDGPFFLWLHYFDPHTPYGGYGSKNFGTANVDRYDSEVSYVDAELGRFLGGIKARGLERDTAIIVFADHGEEWDKKGNAFHANDVNESQIHVPFIFHIPGIRPHRITSVVSNIDVMPTILELVGAEVPESCAGRSLLRFALFGQPSEEEANKYPAPVAFSESFEGTRRIAARRGNMKLVYDVEADVYTLFRINIDSPNREVEMVEDESAMNELKQLLSAFETGPQN